jgi:hypothetical protein
MSAKGTPIPEPVTDPADYLRNKTFRQCRQRHDNPPSNQKIEQIYNDPEWNFRIVNRCRNGCGYTRSKPGYRDANGDIRWGRPKTEYEVDEYLLKGVRIYPRDAAAVEVNEVFKKLEEAAERARRRRKAVKAAAPAKASGAVRRGAQRKAK